MTVLADRRQPHGWRRKRQHQRLLLRRYHRRRSRMQGGYADLRRRRDAVRPSAHSHRGNEVDALIAAAALIHGLTVVMRNVKDFEGSGVIVVDPWLA
jgi:toxin FitB